MCCVKNEPEVDEKLTNWINTGNKLIVCNVMHDKVTVYARQHIWCLSQARINWEGCAREGIQCKNGGDGRGWGTY